MTNDSTQDLKRLWIDFKKLKLINSKSSENISISTVFPSPESNSRVFYREEKKEMPWSLKQLKLLKIYYKLFGEI